MSAGSTATDALATVQLLPAIDAAASILIGFVDIPEVGFDPPDITPAAGQPDIQAVGDLDGNGTPDVVAVIPDAGIGRFGLAPHQAFPSNAYVALEDLQGALDQDGNVNAVLHRFIYEYTSMFQTRVTILRDRHRLAR